MSWIKKRPLKSSIEFISQVSDLCSSLGGPLASELNQLIQQRRFKEVIEYEFDYKRTYTYSDLVYSRQICGLVQKQDFIDVGIDKEQVAYTTFKESEEKCRLTNDRLTSVSPDGDVAAVLHYGQRKAAEILGDLPSLDSFDFSFGPGASTGVKMAESCFRRKLSASLTCSDDMLPFVGEFLAEFPLWTEHHSSITVFDDYSIVPVTVTPGTLCFVPKNSRTKRPIVIEPLLNGMCQKGIGSFMKRRLRRFNIDLRDQSRNRKLALEGSSTNRLATIDLSSASDCISIAVVLNLLPFQWFDFLSRYRTGTVVYRDEVIHLEKFSSMGNGFTFELESLIFYSLVFGVIRHLDLDLQMVSVFGDDIIIPAEGYDLLTRVLDYCGFSLNHKKSYSDGPFRESCGADWWHGLDIRPFYLREEISDDVLYLFHNWAIRNGERELAKLIHSWTNPVYRLYGPDGYGDGHLVGSYRLRTNRKMRRLGWCGGYFDTYSRRKRFFKKPLPGDWLVPSYSVYTRAGEKDPTDPDIVRGSKGYTKISIYTLATSIFRRA